MNGYCRVKLAAYGEDFLELEPGNNFETADESKGWCRILIRLYVKKSDVYQNEQINERARMYNAVFHKSATMLMAHSPISLQEINDTMMLALISGFIEKNCINPKSIPEPDLTAILLSTTINTRKSRFDEHLKKFDYRKFYADSGYEAWLITEPDLLSRQEKPRILIVFYKDELISIFHTRPIQVKQYDCIEYGSKYKLIYNSRFSEEAKNRMLHIFRRKIERF